MKNFPIVKGDANSVLRIGPVSMKNRGDWQQHDSDLFAQFLQVNRQISKSRWSSADCRFKSQGGRLIEGTFPDIEDFVYAAVYFRQLIHRGMYDQLFSRVCDRYTHFIDFFGKAAWVHAEKEQFANTLKSPTLELPDYTIEQIFEAFIYGARILHGMPHDQSTSQRHFHEINSNFDREIVLYSLHSSLKELQNHLSRVAAVIHQDFSHWIQNCNLPLPNVIWHSNLFDFRRPR